MGGKKSLGEGVDKLKECGERWWMNILSGTFITSSTHMSFYSSWWF